jgi:uncharacterized protein (DUF4213/DUF364 family)
MPFQDILQAWTRDLRDALDRESLTVSDVRIGVVYTAAQLSEGSVGLAFTPRGMNETVCCPHPTAEVLSAGRLAGQNAWVLAESGQSAEALRRAVGVATLNALSALTLARRGLEDGRLLIGADALEAAEVRPEDRVAMVGAFSPFLKVLKERVRALWVIEKHLQLLKPDEKHFWCPPEEASSVLREATVVILTGSTLVEGGTEEFLGPVRLPLSGHLLFSREVWTCWADSV